MKEEDKRAVALNSLTSIGKEYVTLSDSTTIGIDVLKDLKKLMELELREKYKVNKTKWRVITNPKMKEGEQQGLSDAYHVINGNEKFMKELGKKFDENKNKIEEKYNTIEDLEASNKTDTDKYKRVQKELKELEKFFVIDMVPDIPISFNSIVALEGGRTAKVFDGENKTEKPAYCVPYIEINKDPKEIATILNDKKELDKIFREKQFKSFDDMVILDFYNEITKKLSDTKDYLRKTDPDIRQDIIDDLYNKLFALYDIKEYYFKDKVKDKDEIKEKYIKEKIRKNNNLSIGGGDYTDVNDELAGGALEVSNMLYKGVEAKPDDSMPTKYGKKIVKKIAPVITLPVEATANVGVGALKGTYSGLKKAAFGTYKGVRATAKAVDKLTDIPSNVGEYFVDKRKKREGLNKIKAEKFLESDKLLHILTDSLKGKNKDVINKELNIGLLKELSVSLNENSIYKQSIDDLINIHDSISSINRDNLLSEQENDAKEYIGKKKEASGEFVLKAVEKYKELKKSFVDKVNKDKDDVEKLLEEEAGDNFAEEITFNTIVNNNSGKYIKKLKNMNSFLYLLEKKSRKTGGAAPMYDVQKLKKDDGEQESSGNTPFDYYKKLKDTYIEIVNQYYKLIDEIGEEEKHYNFIYQYKSLGIEDDDAAKIESINSEENLSIKSLKEAYKLIRKKIQDARAIDIKKGKAGNLFVNEEKANNPDKDQPKTSDLLKCLISDESNNTRLTIEYKKNKQNSSNWKQGQGDGITKQLFEPLINSLIAIEQCIDHGCENIFDIVKDYFKDTSTIGENEGKLNELNEKIQLIENRIKLLEEIMLKIPKEFEKLYKVMKSMKGLSQATEYEEFVINILKRDKIEFFEKDKEKHPTIKALNNEKKEREEQLKKLKSQRDEAKKAIADEIEIKRADLSRLTPVVDGRRGLIPETGGGSKNEKYNTDLKLDSNVLKERYKTFYSLIADSNARDNNLHVLMKNLKDDVEYLENNDDANQGSDKPVDIGRDKGIYEDIWYDYNLAVNKKDNRKEPWKNYLLYLTEGEKVHDRVIQNNLDPEIVLKINFRDKSIYIFLMFLIRTINIIALEFLIEYNLIKSLQYTIMLYGFMYLFIISILIILVNYDSYKLRILFNYLNIHINSSNLLLQNVLFIIFIILVYILVKSDDFLKYFGDLFDFTNIYNNIYKFNESLNEDSDINLTQNEKLKLLYRIDIISMIIFIFSAFLVLIL